MSGPGFILKYKTSNELMTLSTDSSPTSTISACAQMFTIS